MTKDLLNGKTHLVFDDVVANPFADKIQTDLTHPYFPWYLSRTLLTVKPHEVEKAKEDFDNIQEYLAFIHVFFDNSNGNTVSNSPSGWIAEDLFRALLAKLNLDSGEILRCKANFQTQHRNKLPDTFNTPHVDHTIPHYTAIYYVNDSDGDTRLFDKTDEIARISPKKGRIIVFNGQTLHAGSHPYETDYRIVINYNFRL
jgi:hypothetical protein